MTLKYFKSKKIVAPQKCPTNCVFCYLKNYCSAEQRFSKTFKVVPNAKLCIRTIHNGAYYRLLFSVSVFLNCAWNTVGFLSPCLKPALKCFKNERAT